ncbi:MAG: diguanylate cyclase [Phycisphaerales bacterium]
MTEDLRKAKALPTLLLVDDSPAIHRLLAIKLKNEGIDFVAAYSGPEAIEIARDIQPALVLLDVNMPDMDGYEVLHTLQADPVTHDIPVIMLSGEDDSQAKVRCFELGAMDYVTKPFQVAELRARITSALRITKLISLLEQRASIDALTGLGNRAYFNKRLDEEINKSSRSKEPLTLVMCDLDHFKKLNDGYGHPAGDAVLETYASILRDQLRTYDIPCRYGGEEFAIILPGTATPESANICERIRVAIEAQTWPKYDGMKATSSFGLTSIPADDTNSAAAWIEAADQALYSAKTGGRNRVHVYTKTGAIAPAFKMAG